MEPSLGDCVYMYRLIIFLDAIRRKCGSKQIRIPCSPHPQRWEFGVGYYINIISAKVNALNSPPGDYGRKDSNSKKLTRSVQAVNMCLIRWSAKESLQSLTWSWKIKWNLFHLILSNVYIIQNNISVTSLSVLHAVVSSWSWRCTVKVHKRAQSSVL